MALCSAEFKINVIAMKRMLTLLLLPFMTVIASFLSSQTAGLGAFIAK